MGRTSSIGRSPSIDWPGGFCYVCIPTPECLSTHSPQCKKYVTLHTFALLQWVPCCVFLYHSGLLDLVFQTYFLKYCCFVSTHDDVIHILKVFRRLIMFQFSADLSMANSRAVFPPLGSRFQVYCTPLRVEARGGLHDAARGIEKSTSVA